MYFTDASDEAIEMPYTCIYWCIFQNSNISVIMIIYQNDVYINN